MMNGVMKLILSHWILMMWRDCDDPVPRLFTPYTEFRNKIKSALNSGRKESPVVRTDMPFDKLQFDGGLKQCGTFDAPFEE